MEINICRPQVKTKLGIKTDKRLLNTKRAIISALIELLCTKDLSDITVTELAAHANINRKTFYLHYEKIEDVISDFGEDIFVYAQDVLLRAARLKDKTVDIKALFDALNRAIEENLEFFRVFVRSGAHHIFISSAIRHKYISGIRVSFASRLGDSSVSPYVAEYIASGVASMYEKWLCAELPSISLDTLSARACELVSATLQGVGDIYEQR